MVRPICWLHISDIHMCVRDVWSQDVVLNSMCEHIGSQRKEGMEVDFILVTGDLAHSGKEQEYELVRDFFDALQASSDVSRERIYCVPGNHDVDRNRQQMCFLGARTHLQNQNQIDDFLSGGEELKTLLQRQEAFRGFQASYFATQERVRTPDDLAYVSSVVIDDVHLSILGLDSAWLSQGGPDDHGKLVVGERQAINGLQLMQSADVPPHVIVCMVHHPFHLLQAFDRPRITKRIEEACHFVHCGHLHEPESRTTLSAGPMCLTFAGGASYDTRESPNSYSVVTLDLLRGSRTIVTHQYDPSNTAFSYSARQVSRIEVAPLDVCQLDELAHAIAIYNDKLESLAYYLSALLLDHKTDLLVPSDNGYVLASFGVLESQPESALKRKTEAFLTFRNVLRVLYGRITLDEILAQHGTVIAEYGALLSAVRAGDASVDSRLDGQDADARKLARAIPANSRSHTNALFKELADTQDWLYLREVAGRHVEASEGHTSHLAREMLALSLANSDHHEDRLAAIQMYEKRIEEGLVKRNNLENLVALLCQMEAWEKAKKYLRLGLEKFPLSEGNLTDLGQRIVVETGDRSLRDYLLNRKRERTNVG